MKKSLFFILIASVLVAACKPEHLTVPSEPLKSLTGSWQIIKATRNGTDLTNRFDFSKFRINFSDSTYTMDSLVPFIVEKNGSWSFDDPTYPFAIRFTQKDSATINSPLVFPVVGGKRNVVITFSPGCVSNSYQYTLQKANQ